MGSENRCPLYDKPLNGTHKVVVLEDYLQKNGPQRDKDAGKIFGRN